MFKDSCSWQSTVDYFNCYGTIVVGPSGAFVIHWNEETKLGVFICKERVLVITEERELPSGGREVQRRIVAPDNQWYWLKRETHFSARL